MEKTTVTQLIERARNIRKDVKADDEYHKGWKDALEAMDTIMTMYLPAERKQMIECLDNVSKNDGYGFNDFYTQVPVT